MAFCHRIAIEVASARSVGGSVNSVHNDVSQLPGISQPVLLEVQSIKVHGIHTKVMFDKGSSAALVTHTFAERAGLKGELVEYWLVVVGHDSVLRKTTL